MDAYRVGRPQLDATDERRRQRECEDAGARVYRQFTLEEQAQLTSALDRQLHHQGPASSPGSSSSAAGWEHALDRHINDAIERRLASGQDCDTYAIVDEVMPAALAAVPESARAAVMLEVHRMLHLSQPPDLSEVDPSGTAP